MKKILLIQILLFSTIINSQSLVGKKYVAYLGNKCGGNFSSFFYTELNFEKDKVIVSDYLTNDIGDTKRKEFTESKNYNYKIKDNHLTIIDSKYGTIEILNNQLKTNQLVFNIIIENKISKIYYNEKSGGKDGSYNYLEITSDTIKCKNGTNNPNYKGEYYEKTNLELWKKLNQNFNLVEFKKLVGRESVQYKDGVDEEIIVEVDGKKNTILNPVTYGEINRNILEFIELLRTHSRKFEEESRVKLKK